MSFRLVVPILVALLIISPVAAVMAAPHHAQTHQPRAGEASKQRSQGKEKQAELSLKALIIAVEGDATLISNKTITSKAKANLTATVEKVSHGRIKFKVASGTLEVGSTVYKVEEGKGTISLHSRKVVIHVKLMTADGKEAKLVLKGKFTGNIRADNSLNIGFTAPQSKLADQWFLRLKGTIRVMR